MASDDADMVMPSLERSRKSDVDQYTPVNLLQSSSPPFSPCSPCSPHDSNINFSDQSRNNYEEDYHYGRRNSVIAEYLGLNGGAETLPRLENGCQNASGTRSSRRHGGGIAQQDVKNAAKTTASKSIVDSRKQRVSDGLCTTKIRKHSTEAGHVKNEETHLGTSEATQAQRIGTTEQPQIAPLALPDLTTNKLDSFRFQAFDISEISSQTFSSPAIPLAYSPTYLDAVWETQGLERVAHSGQAQGNDGINAVPISGPPAHKKRKLTSQTKESALTPSSFVKPSRKINHERPFSPGCIAGGIVLFTSQDLQDIAFPVSDLDFTDSEQNYSPSTVERTNRIPGETSEDPLDSLTSAELAEIDATISTMYSNVAEHDEINDDLINSDLRILMESTPYLRQDVTATSNNEALEDLGFREDDDGLALHGPNDTNPHSELPPRFSEYIQKRDRMEQNHHLPSPKVTRLNTKIFETAQDERSIPTEDRKPIIRPPFPDQSRDRSPIIGLSADMSLRTCFRVGEALNVGCQAVRNSKTVIIELYARVTSSWREPESGIQNFLFCDLFHDHPPFMNGVYELWKGVELWDYDSGRFLVSSEQIRMCRCIGKMKRDGKRWKLVILNIWEAAWEDIDFVKGIVCA